MKSNGNPCWSQGAFCLLIVALMAGCSTQIPALRDSSISPVRRVDYSRAPEMKELANHSTTLARELYPKICDLLLDERARVPGRFDLTFQPLQSLNTGETHLGEKRIFINSDYLTNKEERVEHFDKVFVHEMTHMAIHSKRASFFSSSDVPADGYWGESIANYAFYKLIGTNGWFCPACNIPYPHYTAGYTCGGAFLLYVESKHGTNIVKNLVASLRSRSYTDNFFVTETGRNLEALWTDFRTTSYYNTAAESAQELRLNLGYTNGIAPKNVMVRFEQFVKENADDFTRKTIETLKATGTNYTDIQSMMSLYLYVNQPGGCPEQFLSKLRIDGNLPGMRKGDKSWISMKFDPEEWKSRKYPVSKTVQCGKLGDPEKYQYKVTRSSEKSDWLIERAWKSDTEGVFLREL